MKKNISIKFDNAPNSIPVNGEIEINLVELPAYAELDDGNYNVSVVGGVASWTPNIIPDPSQLANGDYKLVMNNGVATWVSIT